MTRDRLNKALDAIANTCDVDSHEVVATRKVILGLPDELLPDYVNPFPNGVQLEWERGFYLEIEFKYDGDFFLLESERVCIEGVLCDPIQFVKNLFELRIDDDFINWLGYAQSRPETTVQEEADATRRLKEITPSNEELKRLAENCHTDPRYLEEDE